MNERVKSIFQSARMLRPEERQELAQALIESRAAELPGGPSLPKATPRAAAAPAGEGLSSASPDSLAEYLDT